MRPNVHLNTSFYQRETPWKPNVKTTAHDADIDFIVGLVVLGILITGCLVIGWRI